MTAKTLYRHSKNLINICDPDAENEFFSFKAKEYTSSRKSKKQIESPISTHVGANSVRPWIRFFMSKHSLFCYQSCILRVMALFF